MRVAAFDCGTNSLRLLIADVGGGRLTDVVRTLEVVRLGQGVDRTGRFAEDALQRTLAVTAEYAELCRTHDVEKIRFVATSATRDASNRDAFIDGVRELIGTSPEVISGDEEAALSFAGALSVLEPTASATSSQRLVVDLGGGSTELVLGTDRPTAARSMDVGSVRLTERHVHTDPVTDREIAAIRRDVGTAIDEAESVVDLASTSAIVGVAGTVTTVTAHALRLPRYDSAAINGSVLPMEVVLAACDDLARMPREARAALPYMHPGRVDVIAAGAVVWSEVLLRVQAATARASTPLASSPLSTVPLSTVITSEHDILDGVALSLER